MAMRMSAACSRGRASAFPLALALRDTATQLLGCGITTAYLGVTLSWEPGLRSLETWRLLMAALDAARPGLALDLRVHLRFEADNLDALDDALADIAAGRVHLLGFNDHTPSILKKLGNDEGSGEIRRPRRHVARRFPRADRSASRRGGARCRRPARGWRRRRRRPACRC